MDYPLFPGGGGTPVTPSTRCAYVAHVIAASLAPYAFAAKCLRAGLARVIPDRALSLCSWWDLRRLVSGEPDIDVDNLKRNSKYDASRYYTDDSPPVKFFWRAMKELTPEQRRNFIRFAWGRTRLPRGRWPIQANGQPTKFTIVPRRNHTTGIPLSHTCFFTIELPECALGWPAAAAAAVGQPPPERLFSLPTLPLARPPLCHSHALPHHSPPYPLVPCMHTLTRTTTTRAAAQTRTMRLARKCLRLLARMAQARHF